MCPMLTKEKKNYKMCWKFCWKFLWRWWLKVLYHSYIPKNLCLFSLCYNKANRVNEEKSHPIDYLFSGANNVSKHCSGNCSSWTRWKNCENVQVITSMWHLKSSLRSMLCLKYDVSLKMCLETFTVINILRIHHIYNALNLNVSLCEPDVLNIEILPINNIGLDT